MTTKKTSTKVCDIKKCGKPAYHMCAACGKDLCSTEHTHSFGDGGHIQHSVSVDVVTFPYGGRERIWLCPKCITTPLEKSLFDLVHEHGKQIDQNWD